jgi:hypothetical protein
MDILLQFRINNQVLRTVSEEIRVVAFLIEDAYNQQMATNITEMVKTQIQKQMENFMANMEAMRDTVKHITEATKAITNKLDEFNDDF